MNKVRNTGGRSVALALVFGLTVAAGVTGITYKGVSKEASVEDTCAHATWPNIPAFCLEGATERPVRIVSLDKPEFSPFAARFAVAFE